MLNTIDFSPLFRSSVGFDRLTSTLDQASKFHTNGSTYPPYNIEKLSDDNYKIVMAVAGCTAQDIEVTEHDGNLIIKVEPKALKTNDSYFLHRGIAARSFERSFHLAEFLEVKNANISDGLLVLELKRNIPDELKPRKVHIDDRKLNTIEGKAL